MKTLEEAGLVLQRLHGIVEMMAMEVKKSKPTGVMGLQLRRAGTPLRRVERADLAALPFRTGVMGTVLCTQVLEHLEDDRAAAAELTRILAPAGQLIVEVPHNARGYASFLELAGIIGRQ